MAVSPLPITPTVAPAGSELESARHKPIVEMRIRTGAHRHVPRRSIHPHGIHIGLVGPAAPRVRRGFEYGNLSVAQVFSLSQRIEQANGRCAPTDNPDLQR